ncbi:MAG: hypothetical protein PHV34_19910 [Verrucomicrobiae bacterium]|nr:hypothetical protein [Verrucomicrobiae bacterium]
MKNSRIRQFSGNGRLRLAVFQADVSARKGQRLCGGLTPGLQA